MTLSKQIGQCYISTYRITDNKKYIFFLFSDLLNFDAELTLSVLNRSSQRWFVPQDMLSPKSRSVNPFLRPVLSCFVTRGVPIFSRFIFVGSVVFVTFGSEVNCLPVNLNCELLILLF